MTHLRLVIEPIPARSQRASLAQLLPRRQWRRLRRRIYRRAGNRCRACGRADRLHCHEVWGYHGPTACQWLRGFQALCRDCHGAKHILFVRSRSHHQRLLDHYARVNHLTRAQANQHVRKAQRRQQWLDRQRWTVCFGPYNWTVPPTHSAEQRRAYALLRP